MSVIIKGVDMPKSCVKCKFNDDDAKFCRVVARYIPLLNKIPDFCPLGPLPEKHGDLIDGDALKKNGMIYTNEIDDGGLIYVPLRDVMKSISNAKTIVPAEGGDKQ